MLTARRFLRLAPLAVLFVAASLLTACSSDLTGPGAKKRSGYITTSATVQGASASTSDSTANGGSTGNTGSTGSTGNTGTNNPVTKRATKAGKTTSSGYNVPAL